MTLCSAVSILFLSTPSARRATPPSLFAGDGNNISIHALREEGDGGNGDISAKAHLISIHALREEGDSGYTGVRRI